MEEDEEEYDEEEEEDDDRPRKKPRHGGFILDEAGKFLNLTGSGIEHFVLCEKYGYDFVFTDGRVSVL